MSEFNINIPGGESRRLKTAGKYCPADILVTAEGSGGIQLPELSNPGAAGDLMAGKQMIDGTGTPVTGTFTLASEMSAQDTLIEQIKAALKGKAGGAAPGGDPTLPAGYRRVSYIQFSGEQIIDTGIICNQNSQIKLAFTREKSTAHYMLGVASSDNTAAVTAYFGGNWRFGNKAQSKTPATDEEMIYSGVLSNSEITITASKTAISGVNDFETIGSLLIGTCRNSDGTIPNASFVGKILVFSLWQGDTEVLHLVPVISKDGIYRFYDEVSGGFFDSLTDIPLGGGNL